MGQREPSHVVLLAAAALLAARLDPSRAQGALPPGQPEALRRELGGALDVFDRGGRWKDTDSAILGWSCGQDLQALVYLHQATGERQWLERLFRYAETMFSNLTPNRDGFLSWRSRRYSRRQKEFDFAVHDGMVLMPISRAIELVKRDQALEAAYGQRADKLLKIIETQLIPKWDKHWRETAQGGFLVFPTDPDFDPSGATLPHNQYLPLGTVQLTLHRITGKAIYRQRAAKMARFFKSCLRLVDERYEWNYWDAAGEWDKPWDKPEEKRPEDTGHGSLDIGFVLACAENGLVFTETDIKRFANTLLQAMWNGAPDQPTVGGYVNTKKPTRQSGNLQEWLLLCKVAPRVRQVCEPIILAQGSLWAKAQLYSLWSEEAKGRPDGH
ncbi:MAG TPA: hypothetical protein VNE39_10670 [Planctomycetota bacterium]|nr:hypothetical protein [Planctomycetota bacterium]